ncbi:MAG: LysE family transporter [Rhodospirillales bacterium]|nr:LysE family transporter [Rhodospirillales bacterium]
MEIEYFARGLVIGLAIAAPVGPIGLLCIRRSLDAGFPLGFLTGLGAAAADGVYGAVAAFGLTAVSSFLVAQQRWLALGGGVALLWLGWQSFTRRPAGVDAPGAAAAVDGGSAAASLARERLWAAFGSTFLLTLANPATILSFVAVFAGLGLAGTGLAGDAGGNAASAMTIVLGVVLGSAAWWLFLAGSTAALRRQVPAGAIRWINTISGAILAGFGFAALWAALG